MVLRGAAERVWGSAASREEVSSNMDGPLRSRRPLSGSAAVGEGALGGESGAAGVPGSGNDVMDEASSSTRGRRLGRLLSSPIVGGEVHIVLVVFL